MTKSDVQQLIDKTNADLVVATSAGDVTITSNEEAITTFGGNTLQIRLEIPSALKSKEVGAVCIADDGKVEKMSGKKVKVQMK